MVEVRSSTPRKSAIIPYAGFSAFSRERNYSTIGALSERRLTAQFRQPQGNVGAALVIAHLHRVLPRAVSAVNRLHKLAHLSARELTAIPAARVEALRLEVSPWHECCRDFACAPASARTAVMEQTGKIIVAAEVLAEPGFRFAGWHAETAVIWLRLEVLAASLQPWTPAFAESLSRLLTGMPAMEGPRLQGMQGVRLVRLPESLLTELPAL